jgi:hypothetical protein
MYIKAASTDKKLFSNCMSYILTYEGEKLTRKRYIESS